MFHVITIAAVIMLSVSSPIQGENPPFDNNNVPILFEGLEDNRPNRANSDYPVSGYVDTSLSSAILLFSESLGSITVELLNLDTQDSIITVCDGTGMEIIPFNCDSGRWLVSVNLTSGVVYYGQFIL